MALINAVGKNVHFFGIEKDVHLASYIEKVVTHSGFFQKYEIIHGDVREQLPLLIKRLHTKQKGYIIVGSLPYYLTGHLLRIIGELPERPIECFFIVQREVAERIVAQPPRNNLLAASIQYWGCPKILKQLTKNSFQPPPKIDSSLLQITRNRERSDAFDFRFYRTLKISFSHPRKTIFNNLREEWDAMVVREVLQKTSLSEKMRPQALTVNNFIQLSTLLEENNAK